MANYAYRYDVLDIEVEAPATSGHVDSDDDDFELI
jgi:hypothetical protein